MKLRQFATMCCSLIGLVLVAPATWVSLTHQRSHGMLLEVFVTPLGNGQARLSTVYDFEGEGCIWMGWSQDDGWMRPGPDPVLPLAEAEARAESLRQVSLRGERHRTYQVLYRANDPSGTAFISLTSSPLWVGLRLGFACVAMSLLLSIPISLPFMKATR